MKPFTYSLGNPEVFDRLASLAREHKVWRKVANLCAWLHCARRSPRFVKYGACRPDQFWQALSDTKLPDEVKSEMEKVAGSYFAKNS
jgi:hypothetical protein